MARKGEKKHKTDGAILPAEPPATMVGEAERAAWVRIRADLLRTGFATVCDMEQVVLLCRRLARAERLAAEASGLPGVMLGDKIHPLFVEIRNLETAIQSSLGALCLCPRARQSSRVQMRAVEQEATATTSDQERAKSLLK